MRASVSNFMCHNVDTQERFYALHKNLSRARQMRELFVCLALRDPPEAAGAAAGDAAGAGAAAAATTTEEATKVSSKPCDHYHTIIHIH